ncbi:hypothetical protein [Terrisporobacter mayombei]|uniref:Uncharacterized protein n=1 Tax=Terrisporobacter mayombei TaxID=1541 RepID=A0ABY9PWU0_9FIRM|nr:hypothetical protein [Terrisporobacter mayombei]MCC3868027.1 hypothetical protein [Terrisporobacter mayombei]WMT80163.1 hypothetical protein TEMA_04760 [Terrisporobacter mayombei]
MDSLKNQSDRGHEYYNKKGRRRTSASASGSSVSGSGSSVSGSGSSASQSASSASDSHSRPFSE